jgi:glutamine amidotransferase
MLVIVDIKMGNLGSIINMLHKLGADVKVSSTIADIEQADKLILPGVGSFDVGMSNLRELGLLPALELKVHSKKTPILGICLGMQMLTDHSEEGNLPGLGWIKADTVKFQFNNDELKGYKIPHMGWNTVDIIKNSMLFNNMYQEPRFYFAHSYHVICHNQEDALTKTLYGYQFTSSIMKDNVIGVQFHPEKSHKFGLKLLENFVSCF